MMFSFPAGCLHDASGAVLGLWRLLPHAVSTWMAQTIDLLPEGTVRASDKDKLLSTLAELSKIPDAMVAQDGDALHRMRAIVADFTSGYRRRNVMPREGLGRLEPGRFRYVGS